MRQDRTRNHLLSGNAGHLGGIILEHTIVLHWIIERGEAGVEAFQASQSKQVRRWLANTRNTSMIVPSTIERELTDSFVGIDEAKADADALFIHQLLQATHTATTWRVR